MPATAWPIPAKSPLLAGVFGLGRDRPLGGASSQASQRERLQCAAQPVAPDSSASDQPSQAKLAEDQVSQRQPFVGRERELRQLQAAFGTATKGDGALILLVGEPGIGKTALSDQLCRFVSSAGGRSLVGHCYEEGSFRAPYHPFVEVLGTYLHGLDAETLHTELGSSAADLARIVPPLRERLQVSPAPPGDPQEDRWRLLQAATDLMHRAAATQPLLMVLEDLHDADRGTLDLLLYLARNLAARILVVGTYRDVEVDRAHPLSAALTELHRANNVTRMQLHGLTTDEVQRLLAEASQQTIAQPFAELVQRQTEGNPLFVRETLRFVIDTGLVEERDGALRRVGDLSLVGRIPEGLRDAVGKRLSRLSDSTNRILTVASVIGREFQLDVLSRVLGGPEEELEAALEEASAAGIIEERSVVATTVTYRFCHAFFQQTLYDEIVAPRRIRLHQQIARVLEQVHARRLEEHAAELAEHYSFSSDTSDLAKAVRYGELAAKRATEVFAYGEAARQLDRALVVQDLVDPDDQAKRSDLLLTLGEVLLPAGETERVIAHIGPEVLALAEALGDRGRAFRACCLALDGLFAKGYRSTAFLPEYLDWAERACSCADPDSTERVHADLALANAWHVRGRLSEARALRLAALAAARRLGDSETLFRSAYDLILGTAPQHIAEAVRVAEEATGWPRQGVSARTLGPLLSFSGRLQLEDGKRARAEELWRQLEDLADRTHVVPARRGVLQCDIALATVDGRLEDALALLRRYVEYADESGASVVGRDTALIYLTAPVIYLGRAETWLAAFDEYTRLVPQAPQAWLALVPTRAVCLAHLGRVEEALSVVRPLLDEVDPTTSGDERATAYLVMLLQAAILLGHRAAAVGLSARLACVAHRPYYVGSGSSCVARHLGDAAALVGNRAASRAYYLQALESAGKIRFRPELALTHLRLAELLIEGDDDGYRSEALEHLDTAIPELQDMHMQPGLARGLALRVRLTPGAAQAPARQWASDTLTGREREIAGLMAHGLSNHDIAERLVITEGTVEVHVKHILSKLGLRSRSQVAPWFARQNAERPADDRT
jgi:DNA-binding CsgD family transcriptional regulator